MRIDAVLLKDLKELGQREGTTLFMTLLAAWQTLLSRYSGQEDILVATPIANRNRAETESLIGFFVNLLVLRTDLSGDPTFRELLARVREMALQAYAHQDLPFEKLVEELQPERRWSHMPLCKVAFELQNAPATDLKLKDLNISTIPNETAAPKLDLTLSAMESDGALEVVFTYNRDLFAEQTIKRMQKQFQTLLAGVVANPQSRLSDLPLSSDEERESMSDAFNDDFDA
jgi:non-ribosomal peptide synthetase component F